MPLEQSQIQVDNIVGENDDQVIISYGATCISGTIFQVQGGVTVAGIVTAASFSGDGTGLTGITVAQIGPVIGTILIQ